MKKKLIVCFLLSLSGSAFAQQYALFGPAKFVVWNSQARASGMGELGVVAPQGYAETALWQNPVLLGNHADKQGANLSYVPVLRALGIPNMHFVTASYFRKINDKTTWGTGLSYYSYGSFLEFDNVLRFPSHNPELHVKTSLHRRITKNWSLGLGLGYVFSQHIQSAFFTDRIPYTSLTGDLGILYQTQKQVSDNTQTHFQWGFSLMNLGRKGGFF